MAGLFLSVVSVLPQLWHINQTGGVIQACTGDPVTRCEPLHLGDLGVSENGGTPKSSILSGFSIINHPFWGTPIFGNTHLLVISGVIMGSLLLMVQPFEILRSNQWSLVVS